MFQMTQLRRKKCTNIIFFILVLVIPTQNQPISLQPVVPWIQNHKKLTAAIIFFGLLFRKKISRKITNKMVELLAKIILSLQKFFPQFIISWIEDLEKQLSATEENIFLALREGNLALLKKYIEVNKHFRQDINYAPMKKTSAFDIKEGYEYSLHGMTLLQVAAGKGYLNIIKYLVEEKNAEVNNTGNKNRSFLFLRVPPLVYSIKNGHSEIVTFLLERGANKNFENCDENDVVSLAARYCRANILRELINLSPKDGKNILCLDKKWEVNTKVWFLPETQKFFNNLFSKAIKPVDQYDKRGEEVVKTITILIMGGTPFHEDEENHIKNIEMIMRLCWPNDAEEMLQQINENVINYFQNTIHELKKEELPRDISHLIAHFLVGSQPSEGIFHTK